MIHRAAFSGLIHKMTFNSTHVSPMQRRGTYLR